MPGRCRESKNDQPLGADGPRLHSAPMVHPRSTKPQERAVALTWTGARRGRDGYQQRVRLWHTQASRRFQRHWLRGPPPPSLTFGASWVTSPRRTQGRGVPVPGFLVRRWTCSAGYSRQPARCTRMHHSDLGPLARMGRPCAGRASRPWICCMSVGEKRRPIECLILSCCGSAQVRFVASVGSDRASSSSTPNIG